MASKGTPLTRRFGWLPDSILAIGSHPDEMLDRRGKRRIIVAALVLTTPVIAAVGFFRLATGHVWEGASNLSQVGIHLGVLAALHVRPRSFVAAMHALSGLDMVLIALTTMALGGLVASGLRVFGKPEHEVRIWG